MVARNRNRPFGALGPRRILSLSVKKTMLLSLKHSVTKWVGRLPPDKTVIAIAAFVAGIASVHQHRRMQEGHAVTLSDIEP